MNKTLPRSLEILIVDDHDLSAVAVSIALRFEGHRCTRTTTAIDAVAAIAAKQPDVVILERMLKRGEAAGLARELRSASVGALRVIVVSTQPEPEGFRSAEQVDDYLVKPVALIELRAITG